jgi:hypothetical protein
VQSSLCSSLALVHLGALTCLSGWVTGRVVLILLDSLFGVAALWNFDGSGKDLALKGWSQDFDLVGEMKIRS